jgi:hypothetical protein
MVGKSGRTGVPVSTHKSGDLRLQDNG